MCIYIFVILYIYFIYILYIYKITKKATKEDNNRGRGERQNYKSDGKQQNDYSKCF